MYKVSLLVETEGLSMHQLSKVFLITLASFSLVGLAGCADKKSATAPATEKLLHLPASMKFNVQTPLLSLWLLTI